MAERASPAELRARARALREQAATRNRLLPYEFEQLAEKLDQDADRVERQTSQQLFGSSGCGFRADLANVCFPPIADIPAERFSST